MLILQDIISNKTDCIVCGDAAPDWVQVGNGINPGILLPAGSLKEHPKELISFLNAGCEAVKECCPACQVKNTVCPEEYF